MHIYTYTLICTYTHIYVEMWVYRCMNICEHVFGGQRLIVGVFLDCFSPYLLRQCVFLNLELVDSACLAGQHPGDPCLCLLGTGLQVDHQTHLTLCECWGSGLCSSHLRGKYFMHGAISSTLKWKLNWQKLYINYVHNTIMKYVWNNQIEPSPHTLLGHVPSFCEENTKSTLSDF